MRGDIVPPKRPDTGPAPRRQSPPNASGQPQPADVTSETSVPVNKQASPQPIEQPTDLHSQARLRSGVTAMLSKHKRVWTVVGSVLLALIVIAGALAIWYNQSLAAVEPGSNEKVKVTIESGSDLATIASSLKAGGVIRSESAFLWFVRIQGKAGSLQSGGYRLGKGEDVPKIVSHLTSGNTDTFSITFLPGATLAKHRQVLLNAGYGEAEVDAALSKPYSGPLFEGRPATADLEGYIYGETYNFDASATPEQILTKTFKQYQSVVESENLTELYKKQGFSLYQGIILASIIQREVASPQDAAQVAQVFKLRLERGMQLGSDVTYQYIADKTGQARSVDIDSPYNTRRYTGLPPGPISSPGIAALRAVAKPAAGDYLYFLSGDDDKTYFARTNEEHEKNVQQHCHKKCQII